jgi:hypothetical protein
MSASGCAEVTASTLEMVLVIGGAFICVFGLLVVAFIQDWVISRSEAERSKR